MADHLDIDLRDLDIHYTDLEADASLSASGLSIQSNRINGERVLVLDVPRFLKSTHNIQIRDGAESGRPRRAAGPV